MATGWWLFRTLLVRTDPAAPVPGRTCLAHLDALLACAASGPLAEPTRTRRRLYKEMGAQLARSGLSLGTHMSLHFRHHDQALRWACMSLGCVPELPQVLRAAHALAWSATHSGWTA